MVLQLPGDHEVGAARYSNDEETSVAKVIHTSEVSSGSGFNIYLANRELPEYPLAIVYSLDQFAVRNLFEDVPWNSVKFAVYRCFATVSVE